MTRTRSRVRRAFASPAPVPNSVTASSTCGNGAPTQTFNKFYSGSGFTETDNNPSWLSPPLGLLLTYTANDMASDYPPQQTTFPGTTTAVDAVQQCANYAENLGTNDGVSYYSAFQVYYQNNEDQWYCRAYYKYWFNSSDDSNASYFNVQNDQASPVYGYQT